MKLVKLNCPNCGGKVKANSDLKTATCKYCETEFIIDSEQPTINHFYHKKNTSSSKQTPNKMAGLISGVLLVSLAFFMFFTMIGLLGAGNSSLLTTKTEVREKPTSEAVNAFINEVFRKDSKEITKEDLSTLKYLSFGRKNYKNTELHMQHDYKERDTYVFKYSFIDFEEEASQFEESIQTIEIISKENVEGQDFQCFIGLRKLELNDVVAYDKLSFQHMKELTSYFSSSIRMNSAREDVFHNPKKIKEFGLALYSESEVEALVESFPNIEHLEVSYVNDEIKNLDNLSKLKHLTSLKLTLSEQNRDLSWLVNCQKLTKLSLERVGGVDNLSFLHALPNLEELLVESGENIKEISFINAMPKLRMLHLVSTSVIDISPLSGRVSIQDVRLENNKVADFQVLGTLSSLQKIKIQDYVSPAEAATFDLHGLSQLKRVYLNERLLNGVAHMPSIELLSLKDPSDEIDMQKLEGMHQLHTLILLDADEMVNMEAMHSLSALENVFIEGLYDSTVDYSLLFNIPSLKRLSIVGSSFGIDESKVIENQSLISLTMLDCSYLSKISDGKVIEKELKSNGISTVFSKFVNIEKINVAGGDINTLDWVHSLVNLQYLNVEDNYIVDVTPLSENKKLHTLRIKGNPVSNVDVLNDSVYVID